jgi:hypothetical protein
LHPGIEFLKGIPDGGTDQRRVEDGRCRSHFKKSGRIA